MRNVQKSFPDDDGGSQEMRVMKVRTQIPVVGDLLHVHVDLEPLGCLQHRTGQLQIRVFIW